MIWAALLHITTPDAQDVEAVEPGYEHDCSGQPMQNYELRLTASDISSAAVGFGSYSNEPVLNIVFSETGYDKFASVQKGRLGKRFALCFEGRLLSVPILNEYIYGRAAQISGAFTIEEATDLQIQMNKNKGAAEDP
ncbi:SecDF P1 head subdomain-containing protein [Sphingorhabdus sp. Alg231-15]|uniref:SecDF P1 head subdomain-containing protein n=1 Tax=Sphingorhabdus sp. Alg231-15 TaxID=1922222 RepID=UPI000D54E1C9